MKKIGFLWLTALLAAAVVSCASTRFSGTAACAGRVCGPNGAPVEQYTVSFGIGKTTVTGVNGMFVIPDMRAGEYTLTGYGRGWASIKKDVVFTDRRGIVCIQVDPITSVYKKVESYMRSGLFDQAAQLLKTQANGNGEDALFQFYQAVVSYGASPSDKKLKKLAERLNKECGYVF